MTIFDDDEIRKLAKLCRISCTDEEVASLSRDLKRINEFFATLSEIDTEDVTPCRTVVSLSAPLDDDVIGEPLDRRLFLDNAPDEVGGLVRTPPVLTRDGKGVAT